MSEANKALAREWFEQVWNQKSEEAIDRLFSPQCKCYGFPESDGVLVGPEAFKAIHRNFCGAFPDIHVDVEDVIAEGDHIAVRWRCTMTHHGDHLGFPASGRKAVLAGSSFLIGDGKQITAGWNYMDIPNLFQKLQAR
jgi:steroid delta-isomerase-like uncharacterized protein